MTIKDSVKNDGFTDQLIRLSKSCLSDLEKKAVLNVLDNEFLGMGREVTEFEGRLTEYFSRSTLCTSTGTAALHLALQAIEVGKGDEVLVQSLTYVASFQSISATGAKPIACDVNADSLCIDLIDAESKLTKNTKAIMPVHYSGGVGALDEVYSFAKRYGLRVIEDAAHAFGTEYKGRKVGSFGDIACFSFDGIKNITSGEGGCIVTNDLGVLKKISNARLLGVENDSEKRAVGERSWDFDVKYQGWRYHMSDIMAAIGIIQLQRFSELALKRKKIAKFYDLLLAKNEHITPLLRDYNEVVPHIYVVRIKGLKNRAELQKRFLIKNIQIGYHYKPNHWLSMYQNKSSLHITESIFPELVSLPLHPDISKEDVEYVVEILTSTVGDFL
jgi:dTDP-4-amino-4,6-dideoxygalactose transaminase